jgi:hypothetical protein
MQAYQALYFLIGHTATGCLLIPIQEITGCSFTTARGYGALFLFFRFLYRNNLPALVETTIRTDNVWKYHGTAIGAGNQVGGFQCIVSPSAITTAF